MSNGLGNNNFQRPFQHIFKFTLPLLLIVGCFLASHLPARAQVNNVGQKPYLGWSSFSQQVLDGSFLTQANIIAQSDALAASGIQAHGFNYINIDSGWQGSFDATEGPSPTPRPSLTSRP